MKWQRVKNAKMEVVQNEIDPASILFYQSLILPQQLIKNLN
jgi:hypothetical protein